MSRCTCSSDPKSSTTDPNRHVPGKLFCDSACPSCPPSVFGSSGSSSSGDGDDDDDDDEEEEEYSFVNTAYDEDEGGDEFSDETMDSDDAQALLEDLMDALISEGFISATTTTATPTSTGTTSAPTSQATCIYEGTDLYYFSIGFGDWTAEDDGESVKASINFCGMPENWDWSTEDEGWNGVTFEMPDITKSTCVDEQFYEATGLEITCKQV